MNKSKDSEKLALEIAKAWAKKLDIKVPIKIMFKGKHNSATACVDEEKRNVVEITLFDISKFNLEEYESLLLHSRILHELLHWKYPNANEDAIANTEAKLIGLMMQHTKEEEEKGKV